MMPTLRVYSFASHKLLLTCVILAGLFALPEEISRAETTDPLTVQFDMANYYGSEMSGSASITVTLSRACANVVTVDYTTSNGTATSGQDYRTAHGTLTFAPGVTSQTFPVTILSDLLTEATETVQLKLSNPHIVVAAVAARAPTTGGGSGAATLGSQSTATLNIWDCPPIFSVTAVTNPICAGALPTGPHQTVINVSLTNGSGSLAGIPLTLSTTEGTLGAHTGTTDSSGNFSTVLTSNHWASAFSTMYDATVTVKARQLTTTTQVTFNPPVLSASSDISTIADGGLANLTSNLSFNGQPVAGHSLHWSVAAVWDDSGNQVYDGTGTYPDAYGYFKTNAAVTSDSSGASTAVWEGGYLGGKVALQIKDKSVRQMPAGANPLVQLVLVQDKNKSLPEISLGKAPVVKRTAVEARQDIFLNKISSQPVTVHYETMDNDKGLTSLKPYVDYLPTKGQVTFYPGQIKKTVTVRIFYDKGNKGGEPPTEFGKIGFRLYDQSANATLDPAKKQNQIVVQNSKPPVKPTKVQIDPVFFTANVDPAGPLNQLRNPSVVVIETNPDMNNVAIIRAITEPPDADQSFLEWTIKNAVEDSGKIDPVNEKRADFFAPPGWTTPKDSGHNFVWVNGLKPGRVRIGVHIKGDTKATGADYLEAFVDDQLTIPVRINLLHGKNNKTNVKPDQAALHLKAVNVYLRQVGVVAVQDSDQPNPKVVENVSDKLLFKPLPASYLKLLKTNAKKKVVQISYIDTLTNANGLSLGIPANKKFQTSAELTYRIALNSSSTAHKMLLQDAYFQNNEEEYWGLVVANVDATIVDPSYARVISHELGHVMNLWHRTDKTNDPFNDSLILPGNDNLMGYGINLRTDLDLIQAYVIRQSPALKKQ